MTEGLIRFTVWVGRIGVEMIGGMGVVVLFGFLVPENRRSRARRGVLICGPAGRGMAVGRGFH